MDGCLTGKIECRSEWKRNKRLKERLNSEINERCKEENGRDENKGEIEVKDK